MRQYLIIAAAAVVVVLIMPTALKGCTLVTPAPPNQQAAQTAHCIGFNVMNSCNQTITQGQPPSDWPAILKDSALLAGTVCIGICLVLIVLYVFLRRFGS